MYLYFPDGIVIFSKLEANKVIFELHRNEMLGFEISYKHTNPFHVVKILTDLINKT